jgi:hypothetical protein
MPRHKTVDQIAEIINRGVGASAGTPLEACQETH